MHFFLFFNALNKVISRCLSFVCLFLLNYRTDFDADFLIDRVIQVEGLFVCNMHNIAEEHFSINYQHCTGVKPDQVASTLIKVRIIMQIAFEKLPKGTIKHC
jgi:hypothetical protein